MAILYLRKYQVAIFLKIKIICNYTLNVVDYLDKTYNLVLYMLLSNVTVLLMEVQYWVNTPNSFTTMRTSHINTMCVPCNTVHSTVKKIKMYLNLCQ